MEAFYNHYNTVQGLSVHDGDSHLLETYGEDFETVKNIGKKHPKKIWTLLDVGLNYLVAVAGIHYVNRINYVVSVEEWKDKDEEYIY